MLLRFALLAAGMARALAGEDPSCVSWALTGECETNARYMMASCAAACAAHAAGTLRSAPDDAEPQDYEPECEGYARGGECARNPAFMLERCRKSCDAWERKHGIMLDRKGECVNLALHGHCIDDSVTMAQSCNASCEIAAKCLTQSQLNLGVCDKALRCETTDLDRDCAARAARGECATRPVPMARRCLATCSRVDLDAVLRVHLPEAPAIISPRIDLPPSASRAYERCAVAPFFERTNRYKLHYPDVCWRPPLGDSAGPGAKGPGDDGRARADGSGHARRRRGPRLPWQDRFFVRGPDAPERGAAHALGYVHADDPEPCPYAADHVTPRVPGGPVVLPPQGEWHTSHPVTLVHVLASPRVRLLHDFLAPGEADEIVALSQRTFHRSPVRSVATSKRTSSTGFPPSSAEVVKRVRARVAAFSGYPDSSLEPMQIVRYEPSERYEPHHDLFDICDFEQRPRRHLTFLIYLSELPQGAGGDTAFPRLNVHVAPRKNTALVFNDVLDSGFDDERTEHAGTAPAAGIKYAINLWVRAPPTSAKKGSSAVGAGGGAAGAARIAHHASHAAPVDFAAEGDTWAARMPRGGLDGAAGQVASEIGHAARSMGVSPAALIGAAAAIVLAASAAGGLGMRRKASAKGKGGAGGMHDAPQSPTAEHAESQPNTARKRKPKAGGK